MGAVEEMRRWPPLSANDVELVVPVTARPVGEIVATVDLPTPNRILELPAALNVPIYRLVALLDSIIA